LKKVKIRGKFKRHKRVESVQVSNFPFAYKNYLIEEKEEKNE